MKGAAALPIAAGLIVAVMMLQWMWARQWDSGVRDALGFSTVASFTMLETLALITAAYLLRYWWRNG